MTNHPNFYDTIKMIKAIFFDVDGTLISFKTHRMPDSTRESLRELQEKGVMTFVATGRHMSEVRNLGSWTPDGFITLNGGICEVGGETVFKQRIDRGDIDSITEFLGRERVCPFIFVGERDMTMNYPDATVDEMLRLVDLTRPSIAPLDEIRRMEVFQMMGFFGPEQEDRIMELLPHCHTTRWTDLFTDIVPKGVDKWTGISRVIERLGIAPDETMAFGDGGNDVDMLRGAGIGVAMGNADSHVKHSADYVTTSVDRNGIRRALEYFKVL